MTRKEVLLQKIAELRQELYDIKDGEFLRENCGKIGKHYKYRSSYSCPKTLEDYWWVYSKVVGMNKDGLLDGWSFEKDSGGRIIIETIAHMRVSDHTEITEKEFAAAWSKLRNELLRVPV